MGKRNREILTGVEIGTNTIKVVMGEFSQQGDVLSIVGAAEIPSLQKVVKGAVVDAAVVQEQLARTLSVAEKASALGIQDVFLAVTGGHVEGTNSIGSTVIRSPDGKIRQEDVDTAGANARACPLPPDKDVVHDLERRYVVDGNREVVNPVGLVGNRLEADVHIIYGDRNSMQTNCRLLEDVMGYPARGVAFSGVADAHAAFASEDVERGGLLVDLGAGVTEYVVFHGTGCFHSGQFTIGCDHISNDLSLALHLPVPKCRRILHDLGQFGSAVPKPDGRGRLMEVEVVGRPPRRVPISTVEQVIELRLRELFEIIAADLRSNDVLSRIGSGLTLCGGGALIPGIDGLARQVFDMPVRIGRPQLLSGKQDILSAPSFMTPVGLIRWGKAALDEGRQDPGFWDQVRGDARRVWRLTAGAFRW